MTTISFNIPLLSIPLYYILAVYPHGVAIVRANKGALDKHDNRNPKGSAYTEALKKRLTAAEFRAFERAESCHRNHFENMPLYVAAVFAGMLGEQRAGEGELGLMSFVVGWMVIRAAYTANYLASDTMGWSYLRSVLYFAGTGWAFLVIGRASLALGN